MSKGKHITMSQLSKMKRLHNNGNSKMEVAKLMNLSHQTIYVHLKNHRPDVPSKKIKRHTKNTWKPEQTLKRWKPRPTTTWSITSNEEDHAYIAKLAEEQGSHMRIVLHQVIAKYKKRWWQF
jgi:IS30 family transposase